MKTEIQLVHRITKKEVPVPVTFGNIWQAASYALTHDLHVDVIVREEILVESFQHIPDDVLNQLAWESEWIATEDDEIPW